MLILDKLLLSLIIAVILLFAVILLLPQIKQENKLNTKLYEDDEID